MSRFGACILSCDGPRLSADEKRLFADIRPFGFILFARHITSPDGVYALCQELREAAGHNCLITIDQEGGRVQRLGAPHWRRWHPPLDQVQRAGTRAARSMYLRYALISHELRALGLDSNCAPTLDVFCDETHPFLKDRCFADAPDKVAQIGLAALQGHLAHGVLPVIKHIPGHGRATQDSHEALPRVSASLAELRDIDFAPFKALNTAPLAMTAHIVYEALDAAPATLSKVVIDEIRQDIGFDGVLMTDDISMGALKGDLATLSKASLDAGCDVVLHCNDTFKERAEVAEACGEMHEATQLRAEEALAKRVPRAPLDVEAYEAELTRILGGSVYAS
jgi:beta-N-acetylhexosaminidase